jgi:mRNA-degrading endonuclease RelE of RelBE toxin-antitoxin system
MDSLATNPRPDNSKLLVNSENLRRLTVGDYRVIYGIEENRLTVTIELVRHRNIIYTLLAALAITVRSKYSR